VRQDFLTAVRGNRGQVAGLHLDTQHPTVRENSGAFREPEAAGEFVAD
jgi:hypothetical protein